MAEVEKEVKVEEEALLKKIASRLLAADVEEPLVIKDEWVVQVRQMLDGKNYEFALPRVAAALKNVKPEAYVPQFISLGPYHHWKLRRDIGSSARDNFQSRSLKISTAEEYKLKSAAEVSQALGKNGKSFDSIVETIEGMRLDIERFYDWEIKDGQDCKNFSLMMAVDSCFLLYFLFSLFRVQPRPEGATSGHQAQPAGGDRSPGSLLSQDDMVDLSALRVCIKCDILKLENQIPLSVLKHVFEKGKDSLTDPHERQFSYMLSKTYRALSPFDVIVEEAEATKPHLLGYMHALISPFLNMKAGGMDKVPNRTLCEKTKHFLGEGIAAVCGIFITHPGQRDFLNAYNAEQLDKAGIKFQSFSAPQEQIRFDKYSETLYLPQMTVSPIHTEVFLRNMLALEFNDPACRNSVTRYVGLMDCLIDTPNDVKLLRDSDVIRRPSLMLTDEYVAKMWDGMCQPFFTGHLGPPEELKLTLREVLIKKYYKSKIKSVLREFYGEHLSRPWKIIALFIAIFFLVITVMEGYCTFYECRHKSENSKRLGGNAA